MSCRKSIAKSKYEQNNNNRTDAKTELQKTVHGIGHSVIRGLVTAGQWSAADSAIYSRESALYNVVNTASTQIIQTWKSSEAPSLRLFLCSLCHLIRHKPPNEAWQFPCHRRHSNIPVYVVFQSHSVKLSSETFIRSVRICDHLRKISCLTLF